MKKLLPIFLCFISCKTTNPIPTPVPIIIHDTVYNILTDTIKLFSYINNDTTAFAGQLNVKSFGAVGDGVHDDYAAIQSACNYCILHPWVCTTVLFPVGHYKITQSLLLQNNGQFFTIALKGASPAKTAPDAYLSMIIYTGTSGFALGMQLGRNIKIENLSIQGQYLFPNKVNNYNIGTLKFSDWNDGSVSDSRYNPYAGIAIDPYQNANGSRGGTSGVEIFQCAVKQFMVGVALSANGVTQNDEMISIIDDNIEANRVAIAVCQDQSKEIHIDRLKCWSSTYTILDGLTYGAGTGGGSVMINGMNIAGNVNQLFNLYTSRFPLSASNIYSESLFRIGVVAGYAGVNLINCSIDFLTGNGMPAADFLVFGNYNFYGGCLRYYDGDVNHRLNFVDVGKIMFRDMTLSQFPIAQGLYGVPTNSYLYPSFENVLQYYGSTNKDTLIRLPFNPTIKIDRTAWTSSFDAGANVSWFKVDDYILGGGNPYSYYYDRGINAERCPTIQIGRIIRINGTVVTMNDVGLNAYQDMVQDGFYINRLK